MTIAPENRTPDRQSMNDWVEETEEYEKAFELFLNGEPVNPPRMRSLEPGELPLSAIKDPVFNPFSSFRDKTPSDQENSRDRNKRFSGWIEDDSNAGDDVEAAQLPDVPYPDNANVAQERESKNVLDTRDLGEYKPPVAGWVEEEGPKNLSEVPFGGALEGGLNLATGMVQAGQKSVNAIVQAGKDILSNIEKFMTQGDEKAAMELALTFASGGFTRGLLSEKGVQELGMFGGRMARNKQGYEIAREAETRGVDPESIRKATGWFRGADREWRFEIDDSLMGWRNKEMVRKAQPEEVFEMRDVIEHSELFKQYPQIAKASVEFVPSKDIQGSSGVVTWFVNADGSVTPFVQVAKLLAGTKEGMKVIAHELQHIIQEIEGFARGGSKIVDGKQYRFLAGEVEARLVEDRMDMSMKAREKFNPLKQMDEPISEQVFKFFNESKVNFSDPGVLTRLKQIETFELVPMLELKSKQGFKEAERAYSSALNKYGRDSEEAANAYAIMNTYRELNKVTKDFTKSGVNKDIMRPYVDMLLERLSDFESKSAR